MRQGRARGRTDGRPYSEVGGATNKKRIKRVENVTTFAAKKAKIKDKEKRLGNIKGRRCLIAKIVI